MRNRKASSFALLLSLIVPGLSQVYNAERTKGLVIAGVCLILGAGSFWLSGVNRGAVLLAVVLLWISAGVDGYKTAQHSGQPLDWYYRPSYVVTMLLLIGPFALPLLWQSPYFSRWARWGWTALVVGTVLVFLAIPYMLQWIVQRVPELADVLQQAGMQ